MRWFWRKIIDAVETDGGKTRALIKEEVRKVMSKMDDLNAQIVQVGVEVGKHMDAMDSSINTEIVNAQNSITTALANSGASDAQIQAASVALGTLQDAINGHIDTSKAKVDAAFPTPPAAS